MRARSAVRLALSKVRRNKHNTKQNAKFFLFIGESDFFANLANSLGGDVKERSDIRAS